jgi:phosphotriesterase-related protein
VVVRARDPPALTSEGGIAVPTIETVTGPVDSDTVGLTLPHEHVFVDLSGSDDARRRLDWPTIRDDCSRTLAGLRRLDVDLLVDPTALGIGRNAGLLRDVSSATGVRIVCATGIYKGFVPGELQVATPEALAARFVQELTEGIDGTDVRAGVIKLATTETGPTPRETDIHRAGAMASVSTDAAIVLHSPHAEVTRDVVAVLEAEGFAPARLIWAHAHDSTPEENLEFAERGVTISYDAISARDDAEMIDRIELLGEKGFGDRVIVSTDTSMWIEPPDLAYERSIEHLLGVFLPHLEARLGSDTRHRLTHENPVRAIARSTGG